ncbi:hypothetical protein BDV95DRAFT_499947 [Massariosphaeria phaeospora]|uniref:Polarized growth protein Boi2 n=1 Tax=Massariosphaeria phaeospora TaxID=100035 RepID=A0A7C8MGA8_9PLEO|nr:hypothetical protein BDV95DRAFT_499947 [Massariosphaeria phaeospora]
MAARAQPDVVRAGDTLLVVHEFQARSPDELSLARGDRIELIERDDDFGDGWFLGKNTETGDSGLFPEVYTRAAPKPTINLGLHQRTPSQPASQPSQHAQHASESSITSSEPPHTQPLATTDASATASSNEPHTIPLQIPASTMVVPESAPNRTSLTATTPRSIGMALSGELGREEETIGSPVMHETLSVIDEHITDMSTPRHSIAGKDLRGNDSGSEYSSLHRLSYINGHETDEEEQNLHTEQEVSSWSPARVAEYLEDVGVEKKHCDIFREQEINGEVLLGMDQATIFLKEFELGAVGPRLRTWLKIKALQQEVKTVKEAARPVAPFDGPEESSAEPVRNRATSMIAVIPRIPSLRDGQASKGSPTRQPPARAHSTAGHSPSPIMEATSPLVPSSSKPGTPTRPSAASVRNMNHNRRHSSIDYSQNPVIPGSAGPFKPSPVAPSAHKKTPSFDRNWSMSSPQKPVKEMKRSATSNHGYSASTGGASFETTELGGLSPIANIADLDRGYFSGGEVDNRKARNVLRKKDSPGHSRNPSYTSDAGRRTGYNRRHSRLGSTDSMVESVSPVSPAAKAYYGSTVKNHRSSSTFDFVRPLKPMNEMAPSVTKLEYGDTRSIDAIANTPHIAGSETSSQGRASPSPAAQTYSHSFFGKKSRSTGLRAISDAITGGEKANASSGDVTVSPIKESPMQSPVRTGSSTPSGTSKSFDFDNADGNKRLTNSSSTTKDSNSNPNRRKSRKHGTSAYLKGREQISPQQAMVGCDYSGWMKKKSSSLMTTWKTRLFVLRGRRLSYYYTEYDTEEKGLIDISSHRVLPAQNEKMTGLHATITRAASSPTSPHNATIPTAADTAGSIPGEEDMAGMFIFKLVPPRSGLQKGVQFTKPVVHYFAVDSVQVGRLWMAALMKATIDRDDTLSITTTYQQKTISLEKAQAMRQRPPALMDDENENGLADIESRKSGRSKESLHEPVIHEEDERQGLAIAGLDDAKALLDYADSGVEPQTPNSPTVTSPSIEHDREPSFPPGLVTPVG